MRLLFNLAWMFWLQKISWRKTSAATSWPLGLLN